MATFNIIFLFLTAFITLVAAQCDYETVLSYFQRSVYKFTLKLVKRINLETESHFVTSALTPWTLLSVMSHGASEKTRQEIQEALESQLNNCSVNLYLELMDQVTMKPNNPNLSMVERSSIIFFNASVNVRQSFFDDVSKGGIYNSRIMYFKDRNQTASSINEHVQSFTDQNIKEAVTPNDLVDISTLTIDVLTFKSVWVKPFPFENVDTDPFYDANGQQIGDVSLMYLSESFNVTPVSQIKAKVLELPYHGYENRYSLLIFLPEHNVTLTKLLDTMETINISSIFNLYEQASPTTMTVYIPRFKISSIFGKWRDRLISVGINSIFKQQEDNFPEVSKSFLTNFMQRAEFEVSEDEELSTVKATLMQSRFLYDQLVVNRPFLFMIVDRILHVPILTGAYSKPKVLH